MSDVRDTFWNGRVGWGALIVLLGAALPSARADLLTGTDSNGTPVSILVSFFNTADDTGVPLVLTHHGTTVNLTIPENGPGNYAILFGMNAGKNFLDFTLPGNDFPNPPDPNFSYTPTVGPTIGGQPYTIAGSLHTSNPIDLNSWNTQVFKNVFPSFPQVAEFSFSTTGDPMLSFSVDDPNGHLITFTDPNGSVTGSTAPEPASLALAGLGLVGLAGCGWRRRLAV